jgi:hypothetical protein
MYEWARHIRKTPAAKTASGTSDPVLHAGGIEREESSRHQKTPAAKTASATMRGAGGPAAYQPSDILSTFNKFQRSIVNATQT